VDQTESGMPGLASTLIELLLSRSDQHPDKIAFTFLADGEREQCYLRYGELDRRARAVAAKLQRCCSEGQRAILLYPPGIEFIVGFFGCLYAGLIAVPTTPPRPNRPLSRFRAILSGAQTSTVLTTTSLASQMNRRFSDASELASLHWLATDAEDADVGHAWCDPKVSPDAIAFLQYTSGSTASPKGVMVSHRNVMANELIIQQASQHTASSVFVSWLPPFHDMGLIGLMLQPLYVGAHCILMPPIAFLQRPISWLRAISRYRGTTSGSPNFGYDLCVRKTTLEERSSLDLSSWTIAFNGAEPVRHTTIEQFTRAFGPYGFRSDSLCPCYGLAEATLFVAGARADVTRGPVDSHGRRLVGCGQPYGGQRVRIVDPLTLSPMPDGEVGEIWISGPCVAQGYWNRPEETKLTFQARLAGDSGGPFLRTGDLGFIKDGELVVAGRLKDLIIIRGRNIFPQDVEETVEACHPGLRSGGCSAFCLEAHDEERLVVVQEIDARQCPDLDEVVGAIRQAVAEEHEVLVHEVVLLKPGALPRTSSGKLQRWACRERLLSGELSGSLLGRANSSAGVAHSQSEDSPNHLVERDAQ
jgi:acyl-CoA synthetase (AMP-forming)/AMP-acid ligase II